jgi:hypothetical protein
VQGYTRTDSCFSRRIKVRAPPRRLFFPGDDRQSPPQLRYGIIGPAMVTARFKVWDIRAKTLPPGDPSTTHHTAYPALEAAFRGEWPDEAMTTILIDDDALTKALHIADRHET